MQVIKETPFSETQFHLGILFSFGYTFSIWVTFFGDIGNSFYWFGARSTEWSGGRDSLVPVRLTGRHKFTPVETVTS